MNNTDNPEGQEVEAALHNKVDARLGVLVSLVSGHLSCVSLPLALLVSFLYSS